MDFTARLRAAFLTSIADLFFGASAMLLALIVLAEPTTEVNTVARFVDRQLWCQPTGSGDWLVTTEHGGTKWTFKDWLDKETGGQLLIRLGIWVERGEVDCYRRFERASREHNGRLSERGTVTASVAVVLLPDGGGKATPGEVVK